MAGEAAKPTVNPTQTYTPSGANTVLIDNLAQAHRISRSFLAEDDGVTAIEYGLMAALIVIVCIAAYAAPGSAVLAVYVTWTNACLAAL